MSYGTIKAGIGWFIILSQIILVGLVFYFEIIAAKFTSSDRNSALTAILPATGAYFGAAVIHLLTKLPRELSPSRIGVNAVVITFLLPGLLFLSSALILSLQAYGKLNNQTFTDYLGYLQTAQAFICTTIYLHYFRQEVRQYQSSAAESSGAGAASPQGP